MRTAWTHCSGFQIFRQQQCLLVLQSPHRWKWQVCKFDHFRAHLTTALEHSPLGENLVTADSNSSREGKRYIRIHTGKEPVSSTGQCAPWRIRFHKMQKGELTVHHCQKWRGFTPSSTHVLPLPLYLCWLWFSQDPSVNQFKRIYTQPKHLATFFWVRKEHSSQEERVGMSKQPVEGAGQGQRRVKVKPPPLSAAASHCIDSAASRTWTLTAQDLTIAPQITIVSSKIAKDHYDPTHLQM